MISKLCSRSVIFRLIRDKITDILPFGNLNKPKVITINMLMELNACRAEVRLFDDKFGESVEVTYENVKGVETRFDWYWAARNLLSEQALEEYKKIDKEALETYWWFLDTVGMDTDKAFKTYRKTLAHAFVDLYNKDEEK